MKTTRIALIALLLLGATAGAGLAVVRTSVGVSLHSSNVDLGFFYDDLAPYGRWIDSPRYGWVWTPTVAATSWRPYEYGHWVWTDEGWLWVSDEPFGWAAYHYGRWYDDPGFGWAWVPGYDWAPSWVSWEEAPDYVGWAPLPPSFSFGVGFGGGRIGLAASDYLFVPTRDFLAPRLNSYYITGPNVLPIFRTARNVTTFRRVNGGIFAGGIAVDRVARFTGGRVTRFQVADLQSGFRRRGALIQGDRVEVFRPRVERVRVQPPSLRPAARRSAMTMAEFQKVHGRGRLGQAPPPWAPAWGRRGLAPGQLKHANAARPEVGANRRALRANTARIRQQARVQNMPRQHGRSAVQIQRGRSVTKVQRGRPPVRTQRMERTVIHNRPGRTVRTERFVRQSPRQRVVRQSTVRTQRLRPERQNFARPMPQRQRVVRQQPMRTERFRPARQSFNRPMPQRQMQRQMGRPAMRQQQARPGRQQQAHPNRHRPPQ